MPGMTGRLQGGLGDLAGPTRRESGNEAIHGI